MTLLKVFCISLLFVDAVAFALQSHTAVAVAFGLMIVGTTFLKGEY